MNVQFKTMRKFGDKAYVLCEITDYDERLPVVLSACTESGAPIPSDTFAYCEEDDFLELESVLFDGALSAKAPNIPSFHGKNSASVRFFVVCLPWLSIRRYILEFRAIDSSGNTIISCVNKLDTAAVVWASLVASRFYDDEGEAIETLDGRYIHDRIQIKFLRAVEDQDMILVTAEVELPFHDESVVEFDFLDEKGNRLFLDSYVIEDSISHAPDFGSFERRHMVVSFLVSNDQEGVCICATDVAGSVLPGFGMLGEEYKQKLLDEFYEKTTSASDNVDYDEWFKEKHSVDLPTLLEQVSCRFEYAPLISVVCPLNDTPVHHLFDLITSMRTQSYGRWELILVNVSEYRQSLVDIINAFNDERIYLLQTEDDSASRIYTGLAAVEGDFISVVRASDKLASDALFEIVRAVNETPECDLVYSDVDTIDAEGIHSNPIFKPDYSPELLRSYNYIKGFMSVRRSLVDDLDYLQSAFGSALEYDLILRLCENAREVCHVPRILYHLRYATESPYGYFSEGSQEAGRKALVAHCKRVGISAEVMNTSIPFHYRVRHIITDFEKVTIVIPSLGDIEVLSKCLKSISAKITYKNFEIVIVNATNSTDFDSEFESLKAQNEKVSLLVWNHEFNLAKIANFAAANTTSEYLLFLTEDAKLLSNGFLRTMLGYFQSKEVGVVGPKQLFIDGTIENAGIAIGGDKAINPLSRYMPKDWRGYQNQAVVAHNVSAVSGDCILIKRSVFDEVGGFTEDFSLSYADVDFCLKASKAGYYTVFTPHAYLSHFKSVSRARNNSKSLRTQIRREAALLEYHWPEFYVEGDKFYNVNLDPNSPYFALEHFSAHKEI